MPSESNLIRLYYSALAAKQFPSATILIAHPSDTVVAGEMKNFLVSSGVQPGRIVLMLSGTNTREQSQHISAMISNNKNIVIITSPENMYRSVMTFKKAGFKNTGGISSFEQAMFIDLGYDFTKAGGKFYMPDVSSNISLRYNFWNYLKLEITCIREFFAILYYRLNGWM